MLPGLAVAMAATLGLSSCRLEEVPAGSATVEAGHVSAHADGRSVAAADAATRPVAAPGDVETVDAILAAVYDVISGPAGQERDWDRFLSLFHPGARLVPARTLPASGDLTIWSPAEYVEQVGPRLVESGFFEDEIGRVEERFGMVVHAFSTYESRATADGEPFSRGINSFQLIEHDDRYWVLQIVWDSEAPDRPIPSRYLEFVDPGS